MWLLFVDISMFWSCKYLREGLLIIWHSNQSSAKLLAFSILNQNKVETRNNETIKLDLNKIEEVIDGNGKVQSVATGKYHGTGQLHRFIFWYFRAHCVPHSTKKSFERIEKSVKINFNKEYYIRHNSGCFLLRHY